MKEDQRRWFQIEKSYLNSGCKEYIAKYKIPTDQENGTNSILWINLIPDKLYSEAELLSVKVRMASKNMITEILHSVGSEPLGKIKPEPEWHTGHAERQVTWSTSVGSFGIKFSRKFNGLTLTISEICLSSEHNEHQFKLQTDELNYEVFEFEDLHSNSHNDERTSFQLEDGRSFPNLQVIPCPQGYEWVNTWMLEPEFNEDGWVYSQSLSGPWLNSAFFRSKFRRRKWIRAIRQMDKSTPIPVPTTKPTSFVNDADRICEALINIDDSGGSCLIQTEFDFEMRRYIEGVAYSKHKLDEKALDILFPSVRRRLNPMKQK